MAYGQQQSYGQQQQQQPYGQAQQQGQQQQGQQQQQQAPQGGINIFYNAVIKTGEYQSNGETKSRFMTIGSAVKFPSGGTKITLEVIPSGYQTLEITLFEKQQR